MNTEQAAPYPQGAVAHLAMYSLLFGWVLAFPFESVLLHQLVETYGASPPRSIFMLVSLHGAGLVLGGLLLRHTRHTLLPARGAACLCALATAAFLLPPGTLRPAALLALLGAAALLSGAAIASWGCCCSNAAPPGQRFKPAADLLIYGNVILMAVNALAVFAGPLQALGLCLLLPLLALACSRAAPPARSLPQPAPADSAAINRGLAFLCLFVLIFTVSSGLMYRLLVPDLARQTWLTGCFFPLPYILAVLAVRNLPRACNRQHMLYAGIAMLGLGFLALILWKASITGQLLINLLLLAAYGVYDLFWWSVLGEMTDHSRSAARVFGLGLGANVVGVLLGGLAASALEGSGNFTLYASALALAVLFVALALLPVLYQHLHGLLRGQIFLAFPPAPETQEAPPARPPLAATALSQREAEVLTLLASGASYRQIALDMHVSENTVKTHVKNIYAKLGVNSRAALLAAMLREKREN